MMGRPKFFLNITNGYLISLSVFVALCVISVSMFYPLFRIGEPGQKTSLSGEWKVNLDDSEDFSLFEYDDSAWDTISLPGKVVPYSINKNKGIKGVCWLRKRFFIGDSGADYGLILGRIAHADETYLNGEKIGETGRFPQHEFSMWNHPRNYLLPERHLRKGSDNVIAVRLSYNVIGEIIGELMITDADYMRRYALFSRFIHVSIGYAAISIGFVFILAFLFSRLKQLEFNENYLYFLQFFAALPIILELCLTWNIYPDQIMRLKVLGLSWVALNVFHPAFLHRFYRLERIWPETGLWLYLLGCLIGSFFTTENNIRFMGTLLIVGTWFIGFYNISCHIEALIRKREHSKIFSFFGIIAILTAMNDGLIYFNKFVDFNFSFFGWVPTVMVFQFGAIFFFMGTFIVLELKYQEMVVEIDDLNRNLENFIIENFINKTEDQSRVQKKSAGITSQAEEKMLAVIDIIRENYLSELSRHDLARTVGVNPDSLGKQFKQYTGKKLGDYIYELRIKEAARRLCETDEKIIAIAFDVGFESLRTFNRIFPKFMKVTPRQYREQHQERASGREQ